MGYTNIPRVCVCVCVEFCCERWLSSGLLNLWNGKEVNCFSHGKFQIAGRGIVSLISCYDSVNKITHVCKGGRVLPTYLPQEFILKHVRL